MAKIICPNGQYNGISATVMFTNGVGETEDSRLIEWFKERGYVVEEQDRDIENLTVKELRAYAEEKGIDLGEAKVKADIIAAIARAENNI
jgi:hypothetical protein